MKILRGKELLTIEQRQEWMTPLNGEWELATYYTFSQQDLEIINRHRRLQPVRLCRPISITSLSGLSLTAIWEVQDFLLDFLAKQLDIEPKVFSLYARRENTLWDYLKELRKEYGFTTFTSNDYRRLLKYLFKIAMENGNTIHLIREALDELSRLKIILPTITTIERVVWEAQHRAAERIYNLIHSALTINQKEKLDKLIKPIVGTG